MLTPQRLTLARTRRGLTQADLARKAGLSARGIGDYEHGRRHPSDETTESLATALGFPLGFLTAPEPAELPEHAVSFRAAAKLPSQQRKVAVSAARLAIEFNAWLEDTFSVPGPDVPTLDHPDAETAAEIVRARWDITKAVPNMVQLLESRGVRVFSLPSDCTGVDAFSFWHKGTPYVFLDPATSPERARFDAAHELGHLVLHHQVGADEPEANAFAAAFLMPRKHLRQASTPGQIQKHRADWHVSALALAYRLRDAGMLTQEQYRTLCPKLTHADGMRRETSRLLATVFRTKGAHQVARELRLGVEDLNALVFGLVLTAVRPVARG